MELNKNIIELTGTIDGLKDHIKKIPRPLTAFNLLVHRPTKKNQADSKIDVIRLVLFDDELFYKEFKNSDRIKISGFLQSRNYTIDNNQVHERIESAIQNYIEFFDEFPTLEEPTANKREVIEWSKIINVGLLNSVPPDSLYITTSEKHKDKYKKFSYRIDQDKIVYKESQHVNYEVVINHFEKLEYQLNPQIGDLNKVEMIGKLMSKNTNPKDQLKFLVTNMKIKTLNYFYGEERSFYNNAIIWEDSQLSKTAPFVEGDFISIHGRLQSREYLKEVSLTRKRKSGNIKRKKVTYQLSTHEISIATLKKINNRMEGIHG